MIEITKIIQDERAKREELIRKGLMVTTVLRDFQAEFENSPLSVQEKGKLLKERYNEMGLSEREVVEAFDYVKNTAFAMAKLIGMSQ